MMGTAKAHGAQGWSTELEQKVGTEAKGKLGKQKTAV